MVSTLMVRRTLLWNSSPRLVDLTSCLLFWKPLTVHGLVGHVQILQNDSNCNTTGTVLTRKRLACSEDRFLAKQLPPTWNTVLSITADYCWVCEYCDHHKWFHTQSFTDCLLECSNFSEQLSYHVTLVMFQLFRFLKIFICNASKAR